MWAIGVFICYDVDADVDLNVTCCSGIFVTSQILKDTSGVSVLPRDFAIHTDLCCPPTSFKTILHPNMTKDGNGGLSRFTDGRG